MLTEAFVEFPVVTMLSAVQLLHSSGYRLHSHPISYGSGSGQQSVTALKGYSLAQHPTTYP